MAYGTMMKGMNEMEKDYITNNKVTIAGDITGGLTFSHEVYGEKFYMTYVSIQRTSGYLDVIPVMISERLIDVTQDYVGKFIKIFGQFRSFNCNDGYKKRLVLYAFARDVEFSEERGTGKNNQIFLDGYICKVPVYRVTPLGREVADILLAVNYTDKKTAYIPCICWGRNARFADGLSIGTHVKINGRIQSRNYKKQVSETDFEMRTAYEVSAFTVEVVKDASEE